MTIEDLVHYDAANPHFFGPSGLTARSGDLGAQQSDDILGFHYFHKDESEFSLQEVLMNRKPELGRRY